MAKSHNTKKELYWLKRLILPEVSTLVERLRVVVNKLESFTQTILENKLKDCWS